MVLALLTLGVVWGVGIPGMILFHQWFGGYWALLGIIPAALVGVPLDRMLDNRCRKTQPIGVDGHDARHISPETQERRTAKVT